MGLGTKSWWGIVAISVVGLAALVGIQGPAPARAATTLQTCYSLTLLVDGGIGSSPTASDPNCAGGRYAKGTVVKLLAHPGQDSSVYQWRGTDDDSLTTTTNTVTINFDQEVGIHYVHEGDPNTPVVMGTVGGVATYEQVRAAEAVIGTDDRVQISPTTNPPDRMVVHLRSIFPNDPPGYATGCTGTFFGPHTIITSGHCVYDSYQDGWAVAVEVSPARDGDVFPYGTQQALRWESTEGWVYSGLASSDYAAVIMPDDTLGNQIGWWSYGYYSNSFLLGRQVTITGYPGDKPLGTLWTDTDPITTLNLTLLGYTVDTYGGQSGSAVYFLDNGEPVAVAIHGYTAGTLNYGPRINKSVANVLAGWGAANPPRTNCAIIPAASLLSPGDMTITNAEPILFSWTSASGASSYRFTLYNSDLSTIVTETTTSSIQYSYSGLTDGTYYWQIRALTGVSGCPNSDATALWQVNVDRTPPTVPVLLSPGAVIQSTQPSFDWSDSTGSPSQYQLQVDDAPDFSSPELDTTSTESAYTATSPLALGAYFWQVRAQDAVGNWSAWSTSSTFTIIPISTTVTKLGDTNDGLCEPTDCSLREAIDIALVGDAVSFVPGLSGTIRLDSELTITRNVTINGPGASVLTVDGQNSTRVFSISSGAAVYISGLTIRHGSAVDGGGIYNQGTLEIADAAISDNTASGNGGGIYNLGMLTITRSGIANNHAANGGGLANQSGTVSITNSTISGNIATSDGGGGFNRDGVLSLVNDTVASNSASGSAGGVYNESSAGPAALNITNTILGGNTGSNCASTGGNVNPSGTNINSDGSCGFGIVSDPLLGPLADNGGSTYTFMPQLGSPAIDRGDNLLCPAGDQRGEARPFDGNGDGTATCDVGAVERRAAVPTLSIDDVTRPEGNSVTTTFIFTVTRTGAADGDSTVQYTIADGTATVLDGDYVAISGILTFGSGVATQAIQVTVNGDAKYEADETFTVVLSGPFFASIADGQGLGTLQNDDAGVPLLISPANGTLTPNNQPTFTWAAASEAIQYRIQISDQTDFDAALYDALVTDTFYQPVPALLDADTYYWRVQALGSGGMISLWSETWSVTIDIVRPAMPALILPADRSNTLDTTPLFKWKTVHGATRYNLQVDDDPAFASPENIGAGTLAVTSYTVPALNALPYGEYYWRVQAGNAAGLWSGWSVVRRFTVTLLKAPANATHLTDTTPTLSWSQPSDAAEFEFVLDDSDGLGSPVIGPVSTLLLTSYTPADPLENGEYWWSVRVRVGEVWSVWMPAWTVTVTPPVTIAPVLLDPPNNHATTDTSPTLLWAMVADGRKYQVQIDDAKTFTSPAYDVTGVGMTDYTPPLPLTDSKYYWRVRALNAAGTAGAWSKPWAFTVDTQGPPAPILTFPADGAGIVAQSTQLKWLASPGAHQYNVNVYWIPDPPQLPSLVAGWTTYAPEGGFAHPYGQYFWRVRAIDHLGNIGPWSTPSYFTFASAVAVPGKPTLSDPATGTQTNDNTPTFTWTGVADGHTYRIQIDDNTDFSSPAHDWTGSAGVVEYVPDPALPDGKYYWRVRTNNLQNVAGSWSAVWNFTVDTISPAAPMLSSPAADASTSDATPTCKWKGPGDGKTFHLQVTTETDPGFVAPTIDTLITRTYFTPLAVLNFGSYRWRVQAQDAAGNWGAFSPVSLFTITLHKSPPDGSSTTNAQPTFSWNALTGTTSYDFELDDSADFSLPLVGQYSGSNKSFKPAAALGQGTYYWRVKANTSDWMPTWTIIITPSLPAKPVLFAPANKALINDSTPTLNWNTALNADTYQVQIDNNTDFSSPEQDVIIGGGLLNYIASELADGAYAWRVRGINTLTAAGSWSSVWTFTIDTTSPVVPVLIAPLDNVSVTNTKLNLTWNQVSDAARYEVQIDPDPAFGLPPSDVGNKTSYKPATPLSRGVYYWQVRAVDKAGNASDWSVVRTFEIVAGVTNADPTPIPTLDILPTDIPAVPTNVPTATLTPTAPPPDLPLYMLESDDPMVGQIGTWMAYDTPYADGGRYLYSSGSIADSLTLAFSGSRVDVVYVKHPALGVFVVEIDGVPVQLVDSTASDSVFGARSSVTVGAGQHTLRVYPMSGTIAIDAFGIEPLSVEPTLPPVEPTVEPTIEPTLPPVTTTEPPAPAPLPVLVPFTDSFDSGTGWTPAGAWRLDAGRGSLAWFADSTLRDLSSSLTFGTQIDLRSAATPQLSVWQKAVLTGGESLAVEVSLDGGLSWFAVDTQAGLISDWAQHTVDLSAYRGAVISLRFTLSAFGPVPDGVISIGVWLDDLAILDVPPVPTAEPTVEPTLPPVAPTAEPPVEPTIEPTVAPPTDLPTEPVEPTPVPTEVERTTA